MIVIERKIIVLVFTIQNKEIDLHKMRLKFFRMLNLRMDRKNFLLVPNTNYKDQQEQQ